MAITAQDLYNWITTNWAGKANFRKASTDPADTPAGDFFIHLNTTQNTIWFWNGNSWAEGAGGTGGGGGGTYYDTVADQTAMLAISSELVNVGDWVERTDTNSAFWLIAEDTSVLANWKELPYPTQLTDTDGLAEGATNLYFTDTRAYLKAKAALTSGANITVSSDDGAETITITATGVVLSSEKGANNGVATLGATGTIPASQLPAIAITNVYEYPDYATLTGDTAMQEGDLGIVTDASGDPEITDGGASYIYNGTSWVRLKVPTDVVTSVNGNTGAIQINKPDTTINASIPTTDDIFITLKSAEAYNIVEFTHQLGDGTMDVQFFKNGIAVGSTISVTTALTSTDLSGSPISVAIGDRLSIRCSTISATAKLFRATFDANYV